MYVWILAMVTWDAPMKQAQRGCHAWQKWEYEISVKTNTLRTTTKEEPYGLIIRNISETSVLCTSIFTILSNKSDTFVFTVRATSLAGKVLTT